MKVAEPEKRRRITLRLPQDLSDTVLDAVKLGLAPTHNAFIEESIRKRILEVRHVKMRKLAQEAMNDPMFVADMHETMRDFQHVDREHWPTWEEEA